MQCEFPWYCRAIHAPRLSESFSNEGLYFFHRFPIVRRLYIWYYNNYICAIFIIHIYSLFSFVIYWWYIWLFFLLYVQNWLDLNSIKNDKIQDVQSIGNERNDFSSQLDIDLLKYKNTCKKNRSEEIRNLGSTQTQSRMWLCEQKKIRAFFGFLRYWHTLKDSGAYKEQAEDNATMQLAKRQSL